MIVTITTLDTAFKVEISTPKPEILSVGNLMPINVSVSVIRDGEKGADGADAINNTLELVRAESNILEGNIDANGNTIEKIRNAVDNQEPATLAQLIAATQEAKDYADTVSVDSVRWGGYWDASTGIFPSNSLTRRGDEFEVSVAGTFSNTEFEVGDIIRARINVPGQNIANWSISQGNVQQATTSRQGTSKVALASNVNNENSTDNSNFVTPLSLWRAFVQRFLQLSWVWTLRQTFSTAPRLSSEMANYYLKLNGTKDITSVPTIPAADVLETADKSFITIQEKIESYKVFAKSNSGIVTNTPDRTKLFSLPLSLDAMKSGRFLKFSNYMQRPVRNGSVLYEVFLNTIDEVPSGITNRVGTYTYPANSYWCPFFRTLIIGDNSLTILNPATNASNDDGVSGQPTVLAINNNINYYLVVAVTQSIANNSIQNLTGYVAGN